MLAVNQESDRGSLSSTVSEREEGRVEDYIAMCLKNVHPGCSLRMHVGDGWVLQLSCVTVLDGNL